MFAKRIELFTLPGFPVRIDASWVLLAFLIVWSLAAGVFPVYYPGLPPATYRREAAPAAARGGGCAVPETLAVKHRRCEGGDGGGSGGSLGQRVARKAAGTARPADCGGGT